MKQITATIVFLCIAFLLACSGSDSGDGGGNADVAAKCNALWDKYCSKFGPCFQMSQADCRKLMDETMKQQFGTSCAELRGIGPTYDQCMSDLDSFQCESPTLPNTCQGVLQV